ncbi:hypothetical protein EJB05_45066, partial [Eragrostis curvula]
MEDTPPPLPLALGPPHLIPPTPTRDTRAIAFLPDLGGFPWAIADESPFFRQVIDLRVPVSAVSWFGSGGGEVAAAAANSVSVFQLAPSSSAVRQAINWAASYYPGIGRDEASVDQIKPVDAVTNNQLTEMCDRFEKSFIDDEWAE